MKKKGRQLTDMGLAALSLKMFFFLRGNSYVIFFHFSQFYAKSRVDSKGVTGLRTRGRPPRLDDRVLAGT
jgi:hypothetical protein